MIELILSSVEEAASFVSKATKKVAKCCRLYRNLRKKKNKTILDPMFVVPKPDGFAEDAVHQDMTQPLSNYFIASSHNTYLETYQLWGKSISEGYRRTLRMGSRCIEIDVRDGQNGSPVVTHGWFTTSVPLREVIEAIKEDAFVTSQYPVILSIEDHTTRKQKSEVCHILSNVLGDSLYSPKNDHHVLSPHSLRNKFIATYSKDTNVPCHKSPFPQVQLDEATDKNFHPGAMVNLPENSGKTSTDKCKKWARKQLVRVYPNGYRIFSGNFCPQTFWREGVQIVALNYQTNDKHMRLNQEMFAQNGKSGYILKPRELRPDPKVQNAI